MVSTFTLNPIVEVLSISKAVIWYQTILNRITTIVDESWGPFNIVGLRGLKEQGNKSRAVCKIMKQIQPEYLCRRDKRCEIIDLEHVCVVNYRCFMLYLCVIVFTGAYTCSVKKDDTV